MPRRDTTDWMKLASDSYLLWADSMMVVGLRTAEMMVGRGTAAENMLMVSEKMQAAAELGVKLAAGGLASPESQAHTAVRHYRRKVSANRRRLTRRVNKSGK
ncbi:hypothetical protein [Novosphingobium sp. 9]|uniref:hypothetical protein n=1 Tax=Novosphingobium sp. 9 TaxID=2025349 RepID=UPI0021B503FF|nr:hypothetical protein [Novosphingobium sp. 9]